MNAMLEAWGQQPVTGSGGMATMDEMGGMDHGEMGGMSGMMSQEDMTALEEAQGTEAARLYLEQMTAHHEGAVDMARDEVPEGVAALLAPEEVAALGSRALRIVRLPWLPQLQSEFPYPWPLV